MQMKYIDSIFGSIASPESFIELLEFVNHHCKHVNFWRGQSDIGWRIDSGAARRLKNDKNEKKITECHIAYYEQELLKKARKTLFDFDEHNRKLSDFELLAKLQHHGAATRLVDFSKSMLVGLFFCCYNKERLNEYGLLLGIDTNIIGGHEDDFDFDFTYTDFQKLIAESGDNYIYCISPPIVSRRISAQHAVFLCSKYIDGKYGSLSMEDKNCYYNFMAISPELKKTCNEFLTSYFDITSNSMFPDFEGFCSINSTQWGLYEHSRW